MRHPSRIVRFMVKVFARVRGFFTEVPGSLKHHLNTQELTRITIAALSAGGGIYGLLHAIVLNAGAIFPAPVDAALAAVFVTTILETFRRLDHGRDTARELADPRRRR